MDRKVSAPHKELTCRIIGAAMAVHRRLGPGHKEAIYQRALEAELEQAGLAFEPEKTLEVFDKDRLVGYYIPDFIVEIKALSALPEHALGQVIA